MDDAQRQALKDYFPPTPQPEFLIPKRHGYIEFTLLDFEGEQEIQPPNCDPCTRFIFNVVDHTDERPKLLSVGKSIAAELMKWATMTKPQPPRNWFMRLLERVGLTRPLPEEYYEEFKIRCEPPGRTPWPRYHVYGLD